MRVLVRPFYTGTDNGDEVQDSFIGHNQFSGPSDIAERFWSKYEIDEVTGCWNWTFSKDKDGYGKFEYFHGYTRRAPIVAFELSRGRKVTAGLWVLHTCDNHGCINPEHIYEGTPERNSYDRDSRGRANSPKGIRNGMAKLTPELVNEIRFVYKSKKFSQKALGARYNVSQQTICRIVNKQLWAEVA